MSAGRWPVRVFQFSVGINTTAGATREGVTMFDFANCFAVEDDAAPDAEAAA
jgi:hypothetical protein